MIPVQLIGAGLIAAASFGAGWATQGWRADAAIAKVQSDYLKRDFRALETAHAETISLQTTKDEALQKAAARGAAMARAAADSRIALDRMQDTTTKAMRVIQYSHGAAIATATAYKDVYGECAIRLVEVGQKSDGHASDVRTLTESWPVQ